VAQNSPLAVPCKGDKLIGLMECVASFIRLSKDFAPRRLLVNSIVR
jgi:hypothetical protein